MDIKIINITKSSRTTPCAIGNRAVAILAKMWTQRGRLEHVPSWGEGIVDVSFTHNCENAQTCILSLFHFFCVFFHTK